MIKMTHFIPQKLMDYKTMKKRKILCNFKNYLYTILLAAQFVGHAKII